MGEGWIGGDNEGDGKRMINAPFILRSYENGEMRPCGDFASSLADMKLDLPEIR